MRVRRISILPSVCHEVKARNINAERRPAERWRVAEESKRYEYSSTTIIKCFECKTNCSNIKDA